MRLVNLTPHSITVLGGVAPLVLAPSGSVARVAAVATPCGTVGEGIPLARLTYGEVTGLPDQQDAVLLVVSGLVRAALPARTDLASPGELVRDAAGQPVGCRGLVIS